MTKLYLNAGNFGFMLSQPDLIFCNFCATVAADSEVIRKVMKDKWWHKVLMKTSEEIDWDVDKPQTSTSERQSEDKATGTILNAFFGGKT